jgi:hypothetical protein
MDFGELPSGLSLRVERAGLRRAQSSRVRAHFAIDGLVGVGVRAQASPGL